MLDITIKYKDTSIADTVIDINTENATLIYSTPISNMNHLNIDLSVADFSNTILKEAWNKLREIDTSTVSEVLVHYDIISYHKTNGINTFDYMIQSRGDTFTESLIIWG